MESEEEFKCVFCDETFDDKETLQVHFRKHADPGFKSKKRYAQEDSPIVAKSPDDVREQGQQVEMVECDVCPEVFTSISKAITHKHRFHPDHTAKYFCPWCGKLFTMKHLYNKHMDANHPDHSKSDDKYFHCDGCNVDFNIPAAMMYHNKFYHRQESAQISVGISKKFKMYHEEVVLLYYCSFCGEEYENRVNLGKHITDDHSDENHSPDVVLRCPLCDAIFYHLDAYEVHLTYHSIEDLYNDRSEMADEVTEFSLESVPPIAEKVENTVPNVGNDYMGIEQLLEMAMEEPQEKKSKKHKKHKKSKKSAITLDEFFNMNKDVFGEEIDFQGVEEVPTQVVAKRLKNPKKTTPQAKFVSPDIEKLKMQGIVVKKKPGPKPGKALLKKVIPTKVLGGSNTALRIESSKPTSSKELISKLLNQSNSQIKIVKKSITNSKSVDTDQNEKNNDTEPPETSKDSGSELLESSENKDDKEDSHHSDDEDVNVNQTENTPVTQQKSPREFNNDENSKLQEPENNNEDVTEPDDTGSEIQEEVKSSSVIKHKELDSLKNNSKIVIKPTNTENMVVSSENNLNQSKQESMENDDLEESANSNKNNSLNALKHLSHLTIKSVNQNKTLAPPKKVVKKNIAQNLQTKNSKVEIPQPLPSTEIKPNKELTVESSVDDKNNMESDEYHSESEHEDNLHIADVIPKNIVDNKVSDISKYPHLSIHTLKSSPKTSPLPPQMLSPKENTVQSNKQCSVNLLKHLKNVTAKPINKINAVNNCTVASPKSSPKMMNIKKEMIPATIARNPNLDTIEVFNIDDSDDEEEIDHLKPSVNREDQVNKSDTSMPKNEPSKQIHALKNLNKNITIKSLNHTSTESKTIVKHSETKYNDDSDNSNFSDFDEEQKSIHPSQIKKDCVKQQALNNVLKNLGKNITVKSRNSSPSQVRNQEDQNLEHDNNDSDTDSQSSQLKIKEIENNSGDEFEEDHERNDAPSDNVHVQYPDDSNSDFEEADQMSDPEMEHHIESIKKETNASNQNLNTLKKLSKDIIIKPSNRNSPTPHSEDVPPLAKRLGNQMTIKNYRPNSGDVARTTNQSDQKMTETATQMTTKEVKTVKKFQTSTETVIQEITTTITKSVKTLNQSNTEVRSQGQQTVQRVRGMLPARPHTNYQGVKVRQAAPPAALRLRQPVATLPRQIFHPRTPNQIGPLRHVSHSPRPHTIRPTNIRNPRPPTLSKIHHVGTPVKIAAGVINNAKRPNQNDGHFSCFKKPKESLIPGVEVSTKRCDGESVQSIVQMNRSNYSCTTKAVKGNSVVTSTKVKSEMSASSQQLSKLRNVSGLNIVKTSQVKQAKFEEKTETSAPNRTTLEAIQKLQSQGLLVKKPRLDVSEENAPSEPESDDGGQFSDEEMDT